MDSVLECRPRWLDDYEEFAEGQTRFRLCEGGRSYVAIIPFLFTSAVILGDVEDETGYRDRWCYHDFASALAAFEAWDGTGEPAGWHRHPASGRRRNGGDPGREYVAG